MDEVTKKILGECDTLLKVYGITAHVSHVPTEPLPFCIHYEIVRAPASNIFGDCFYPTAKRLRAGVKAIIELHQRPIEFDFQP